MKSVIDLINSSLLLFTFCKSSSNIFILESISSNVLIFVYSILLFNDSVLAAGNQVFGGVDQRQRSLQNASGQITAPMYFKDQTGDGNYEHKPTKQPKWIS